MRLIKTGHFCPVFVNYKATAALILLSVLLFFISDNGSRFYMFKDGQLVFSSQAKNGFTLHFIHSINLSPVDESFSVSNDGFLVLDKVEFNQFGTGTPASAEEGVMWENNRYVTKPLTKLSEIAVRVSPVPGHELRINNNFFPLTWWTKIGGLLVFRAKL